MADTDRDGNDEIIIGYYGIDESSSGFYIHTLDADSSATTIPYHNRFHDDQNERSRFSNLRIVAEDLNKDGYADMIAGFEDRSGQMQIVRLTDSVLPKKIDPSGGITLESTWRSGTDGLIDLRSQIALTIGDWNNDSIFAHYEAVDGGSILCKKVTEAQITTAVYMPPNWENIANKYPPGTPVYEGAVGRSTQTDVITETAYTINNSHSAYAYVGGGVDVEVASASLKVKAGYELSASRTRGKSISVGETTSEGWSNTSGDYAIIQNTEYNCYSYQLKETDVIIDAMVRFCEYQKSKGELAPVLDTWDTQLSPQNNQNLHQWAPVVRDWSNLAVLRGAHATQSSTDFGGEASRAVDNNTSGLYSDDSITHTADEHQPWWQVDLGVTQPISKLRIWNRSDSACPEDHCARRLTDFYLFVSDTDLRDISNDPAVLKDDARVIYSHLHAGTGRRVTTLQTLQNGLPIQGRYVRIQLANSGILSLADVQVFGPNHVEPDQYPRAVRDTIEGDGFFEAERYDAETDTWIWVRTAGDLLWNGALHNVLANKAIGPGGGASDWSLTTENATSTTKASATSSTAMVGIEMDVEVGIVQFGGGVEFSGGIERSEARTLSFTEGFQIGGTIAGFPPTIDGTPVRWPLQCTYQIRPYYYWMSVTSDYGFVHRFLVIDYTVPDVLDRKAALADCHNGRYQLPAAAPLAVDDNFRVVQDSSDNRLDVLKNDSDINGDPLAISAVDTPINGTASIDGNLLLYTPKAGFNGIDSFAYTISDGTDSASATVTVTVTKRPDGPTNRAPNAVDDTYEIIENSVANMLDVLNNDSDIDGDPLMITAVSSVANGALTIKANMLVYTPTTDFNGSESFTYTISDGKATANANVTLTVKEQPNNATDPNADSDDDGILNKDEDVNGDGNWVDDDTDGDNIPNYLDDDDDDDGIPTRVEGNADANNNGIPDHLEKASENSDNAIFLPYIAKV